ncbi:hypothetical protein NBRC116188_05410 [Oceaniserpentilla sp. 4NH20-0058]|uniref:hypothetical protein n=1 Tax=Oceaniserpentilla sp. 4NH20-0058 TaxID=3127660 RepID=UPI00310222FC
MSKVQAISNKNLIFKNRASLLNAGLYNPLITASPWRGKKTLTAKLVNQEIEQLNILTKINTIPSLTVTFL